MELSAKPWVLLFVLTCLWSTTLAQDTGSPDPTLDPTAAAAAAGGATDLNTPQIAPEITPQITPITDNLAAQGGGVSDGSDEDDNLPPLSSPTPITCPALGTCPCFEPTWKCNGVPVDPAATPNFKCPGSYSRTEIPGGCACYDQTARCVVTKANFKIKAKNLDKIKADGPKCQTAGFVLATGCTPTTGSDPIITGFDDRKFHFNEVGNFTLLSDGEGYMVETTFVGVPPVDGVMPKETSWTNEVRIYNARGDKITCHLPAILPNTSRVEMYAQAAGSAKATPMTPYKDNIVEFEDMSATAVSSGWPNPHVTGCHVSMAKLDVIVYQVSGWSQATKYESEKWAAPYTWLNIDVKLLKPLALPVTGILGATYPVTLQGQAALKADEDISQVIKANVATDPDAMHDLEESSAATPGKARRLASAQVFPLQATVELE